MEIRIRNIATGQHLQTTTKTIFGKEGDVEILININGHGIKSQLSHNGYGYDYHTPCFVKEMKVVITGGNLGATEYMVRTMTPAQIYEVIRDGFTVTMAGIQ